MADRDLYELIEGADCGLLGEGDGWRQVGMRWRPLPEPDKRPTPIAAQLYEHPGPLVVLWDYLKSGTRKLRGVMP